MSSSVRIKRNDYAQLDPDPVAGNASTFPRGLGGIFSMQTRRPGSSRGGSPPPRPTSLSPPGSVAGSPDRYRAPSPTFRRPRAGSRVENHLINRSSVQNLRNQRSASSIGGVSRRSSTTRRSPGGVGNVTLEGSQAEVVIQSDHEEGPGILDDALSIPHTELDGLDEEEHHHDDIVDHLDVIDAQVATVSNLTNATNSLLIPPYSFWDRRPVVYLTAPTPREAADSAEKGELPEDQPQEDALDRHVEDLLAKPSKLKRTLKGVWSFLKTPMGIVTGIYGFLCAFWGAAIVFFLAKFINFHNANTQGFWVEVSSQVENALFTVTGVGLIPFRAVDTYRVYKIWSYKRRTRKLRAKAGLPQLYDEDDLPDPAYDPNYVHVLDDDEQADLHHQQESFRKSQTWYRPHGTETHRAFPINTALLICLLIDGNSFFQIILCGTMWGLNRFERPAYSTGILIPASFLCGIGAGVFIARGSTKTKRTKEVKERLRAALANGQTPNPICETNPEDDPIPNGEKGKNQLAVGDDRKKSSGSSQEKK